MRNLILVLVFLFSYDATAIDCINKLIELVRPQSFVSFLIKEKHLTKNTEDKILSSKDPLAFEEYEFAVKDESTKLSLKNGLIKFLALKKKDGWWKQSQDTIRESRGVQNQVEVVKEKTAVMLNPRIIRLPDETKRVLNRQAFESGEFSVNDGHYELKHGPTVYELDTAFNIKSKKNEMASPYYNMLAGDGLPAFYKGSPAIYQLDGPTLEIWNEDKSSLLRKVNFRILPDVLRAYTSRIEYLDWEGHDVLHFNIRAAKYIYDVTTNRSMVFEGGKILKNESDFYIVNVKKGKGGKFFQDIYEATDTSRIRIKKPDFIFPYEGSYNSYLGAALTRDGTLVLAHNDHIIQFIDVKSQQIIANYNLSQALGEPRVFIQHFKIIHDPNGREILLVSAGEHVVVVDLFSKEIQ